MGNNNHYNKRIRSAEYNESRRLSAMQQIVVDGDDAEAVYKYAYKLQKEVEQETLDLLLNCHDKDIIAEQQLYYKVVNRFVGMLTHAAALGKRRAAELANK